MHYDEIEQELADAITGRSAGLSLDAPELDRLHQRVESLPIFKQFKHPGFRSLCGVGPILPRAVVRRLLERAATVGTPAAVGELRAFFELDRGVTRATVWVRNVTANIPLDLGSGVRALPISALADAELAQSIQSHRASTSPGEGLLLEIDDTRNPFFFDAPNPMEKMPHEWGPFPGVELIEETIKLMTLVGPSCPVAALQTGKVVTPGGGTSFHHPEVVAVGRSTVMTEEVRTLRPLYKALSPKGRKIIDRAISRLNLACRRGSPSDVALDAAIALETALGGSERTELTYRLALRAAFLLETGAAQRRAVWTLVKELYSTRSRVVHTGSTEAVGVDGSEWTRLIARALRRILEVGGIPDWDTLVLSNGSDPGILT